MRNRTKNSTAEALSTLRKVREGKIRAIDVYLVENEKIYDEVDEIEYQKICEERRRNDFVVDDDGIGYQDDGHDLLDNYYHIPEQDYKQNRIDEKKKRRKNYEDYKITEQSIFKQFQDISIFTNKKTSSNKSSGINPCKTDDILNTLETFEAELEIEELKNIPNDSNDICLNSEYDIGKKIRHDSEILKVENVVKTPLDTSLQGDDKSIKIKCSEEQNNQHKLIKEDKEYSKLNDGTIEKEFDTFNLDYNLVMPESDDTKHENDSIIDNSNAETFLMQEEMSFMSFRDNKSNEIINIVPIEDANECLSFYVVDIAEDFNSSEIYLFGKVFTQNLNNMSNKQMELNESACIIIQNTYKSLYIYPKDAYPEHPNPVDICQSVAKEMISIRKKYNIPQIKMKPVVRNFAFTQSGVKYGPNQPFLKVLYPSKSPNLPNNIKGETFSHIFGLNKSLIENFIIKRRIKGPSWLKIMKPYKVVSVGDGRRSQCKVEIHVSTWKNIRIWNAPISKKLLINKNTEILDDCNMDLKAISNNLNDINGDSTTNYDDGPIPNSPPLTLVSIKVQCGRQGNSTVSEIYSISMIALRNQNIDELCWDEFNVDDILQNKSSKHYCIYPWVGIRRYNINTPFPINVEEYMNKSGIYYYSSEKSLLLAFVIAISQLDPDIIIGHNIWNEHLDILCNRLITLNTPNIWKLGKLNIFGSSLGSSFKQSLQKLPSGTKRIQVLLTGRLICDTCLSSREFLKSRTNYQLHPICMDIFPNDVKLHSALEGSNQIMDLYKSVYSSIETIHESICRNFYEALGVLKLLFHLQVLPLTRELTNIAGFLWSKSLLNLRAERNEYLLLHEFHQAKFVTPDKITNISSFNKNQSQRLHEDTDTPEVEKDEISYIGGLVLEPLIGLYDRFVILLDFNSLYPSIIQEFNICFTKRNIGKISNIDDITEKSQEVSNLNSEAEIYSDENIFEYQGNIKDSLMNNFGTLKFDKIILPSILESLVRRRKHIKDILKNLNSTSSSRRLQLEIRQLALKLTANSLYGCLGYKNSRFYARDLASTITLYGRQILQSAKNKVEDELKLQVIYGDTDSIMVNTGILDEGDGYGYQQVLKLANQIKQLINKDYKKLEIDLDDVLQRLLLLKKKKYACVKVLDYYKKQFKLEYKGLDLVRRDWSKLTRDISKAILNSIFSNKPIEEVILDILTLLEDLNEKLSNKTIEADYFTITKALNKLPQYYSDPFQLPHVIVAKRLINSGHPIRLGTEISYIICMEELTNPEIGQNSNKSQSASSLGRRAYSLDEVKQQNLEIDIEWYKRQQLLPPISRLCAPIPGLEISRLASCLGLDSKYFYEIVHKEENDQHEDPFIPFQWKKSPENYDSVPILASLPCLFCRKNGNDESQMIINCLKENLWTCNVCSNKYPLEYLTNWLNNHLRSLTLGCYSAFCGTCKECNISTRRILLSNGYNCPQLHCKSKNSLNCEVSPHRIWLYLDHWLYWLNLNILNDSKTASNSLVNNYEYTNSYLKDIINKFMNMNRYNNIPVHDIFQIVLNKRKYTNRSCNFEEQSQYLTKLWSINLILEY
ncbi:DNA polymerase family protein [Cryptosporidium andersoni]|uniref:DNA polymerase n=1 Tax=Cryptosporidium andersoni TaxID=117008 RepID=A0A1J4MSK1_9CRYT|nr:DNA polymerase family protein [Cryptosporidium andersoni]